MHFNLNFNESVKLKSGIKSSHIEEYRKKGKISDPSIIFDYKTYNPWSIPENPFDYVGLIGNSFGIGSIPKKNYGKKVAVIGAGCAGLCAAYELMKIGLQPVVYESSDRIGGRAYSYHFPKDTEAFAEIGAMRIPTSSQKTVTYYLNEFEIDYSQPFQDPLVVPTTLFFQGKKYFIDVIAGKPIYPLPPEIEKVLSKFTDFISPIMAAMNAAGSEPVKRAAQWMQYVEQYLNKSFFQVLVEACFTLEEIELLGQVGLGTGGLSPVFPVSFIEILRVLVCGWANDQRKIIGGVNQIPMSFWLRQRDCVHWGQKSVRELHEFNNFNPLPAVTAISKTPNGKITVSIAEGSDEYEAVIISCSPRALEMNIQMDISDGQSFFSQRMWTAIRNVHMMNSGKVFIRTKTAFWNEKPHDPDTLHCTLTDLPSQTVYLFDKRDFGTDTLSGVICLSYNFEGSSVKFESLSTDERVRRCLADLEVIYGADWVEKIHNEWEESFSFVWQNAYGYNGAFKLSYPGQYNQDWTLFTQGEARQLAQPLYLAGEATSWAGGWIEGALHTGLNASMSVIKLLGGSIYNPNT